MTRVEQAPPVTRVLVTGGAGFIGSHLCGALQSAGHEVLAMDSLRSGDWARLGEEPVERWQADLVDPSEAEWAERLSGVEVVFHLAAEKYNSSKSTPQRVIDVNVSGTNRMLRGAGAAGVRKVVFTSSLYAYGSLGPGPMVESDPLEPTTLYGASKVMGEHLVRVTERDFGLAWSVGRLFFVYGPRQHAEGGYPSVIVNHMRRIRAGEPPVINGDGLQSLDYVYVDDVVEALIRLSAPDADRGAFNIGTGTPTTVRELTSAILDVTGATTHPVAGEPDWTQGTSRFCDPSLIERTLGWTASTSLREGLERVWAVPN